MHTPTLVQLVLGGLAATSAVYGFQPSSGVKALSARNVASLIALAAPAMAVPMMKEIDTREPHHAGKKTGNAKHARDVEEDADHEDVEEEDLDLETRAPHHAGKKTGKKQGRDVEVEAREPHHAGKKTGKKQGRDVEVETREPHHAGKKTGKKQGRDVEEEDVEEEDLDLETRAPHHAGKKTGKKQGRDVEVEA
ncbi:hypothetical protein Sste5346_009814, partial [Sporothrix stenoceras]